MQTGAKRNLCGLMREGENTNKTEMNRSKLILPLLFDLALSSCTTPIETIDQVKVENAFVVNSSPTFKGYFYNGSDSEYHYFITKWDWKKDNYFRLEKKDLIVNQEYQFETKELRIDLFETDEKFGENQFYELYIAE